ncbi:hypothetical protein ADL22_20465 [Streptomyces sp. NRRL F-4489]|uniref:hypothetical protein n=1 Tax=Streptomyces sp. NRRL F-4489 TaxID=1609095 RepID=UPI0007497F22|nr:hypothetical protein [Streptomyces sp. NRRL F-4489]KUL37767.1 hypothetical protein ADL22_20465 [Streptomyces sp. NRRL F-4489]
MGWTILYIAFGLVALWLLGEVLFQHKARLRWRALALAGFLGVVIGVIIPSVIVVALGAIAFATGQTYVTLSVRRGFAAGWTVGGRPKPNRRRRARPARGAGPTLQVSGLAEERAAEGAAGAGAGAGENDPAGEGTAGHEAGGHDVSGHEVSGHDPYAAQPAAAPAGAATGGPAAPGADFGYAFADAPTVYAPQPLPDETGAYGVYSPDARADRAAAPVSYDLFGNATTDGDPAEYGQDPANGYGYGGSYGGQAGHDGYGTHDGRADPYPAYDGSYQGAQAPYSDPYIGTQQYAAAYDPYEEPDPFGGTRGAPYAPGPHDGSGGRQDQQYGEQHFGEQHYGEGYGDQGYGDQHYGGQGYGDRNHGQGYHPGTPTPPDGVWVPQQRDTGHAAADQQPQQPPYPPQPGHEGQPGPYDGQRYPY